MPAFICTINPKKILNSTLDSEVAEMLWVVPSKPSSLITQSSPPHLICTCIYFMCVLGDTHHA